MSTLERGFTPTGDRYEVDQELTIRKGWFQIDTWQDASYFGIWTNPFDMKIFTHCEGDRTRETCTDDEDYKQALQRCLEFYDTELQKSMIDCVHASTHGHPEGLVCFTLLGFADRCH